MELDGDRDGGGCGRNGGEKEGESTETGVGFEYKWSWLAPELTAIPDGEEMEPVTNVVAKRWGAPDRRVGAATALHRVMH